MYCSPWNPKCDFHVRLQCKRMHVHELNLNDFVMSALQIRPGKFSYTCHEFTFILAVHDASTVMIDGGEEVTAYAECVSAYSEWNNNNACQKKLRRNKNIPFKADLFSPYQT